MTTACNVVTILYFTVELCLGSSCFVMIYVIGSKVTVLYPIVDLNSFSWGHELGVDESQGPGY